MREVYSILVQGVVAGMVAFALFSINVASFPPIAPLPPPASVPVVQVVVEDWRVLAHQWEERLGLPYGLLEAVCDYESESVRPRAAALSPVGAVGVCQVLPGTAAWLLGIDNPSIADLVELHGQLTNDAVGVMFGGQYLANCWRRNRGRTLEIRARRALWCYNEGHNKKPETDSTYIRRVMAKWDAPPKRTS